MSPPEHWATSSSGTTGPSTGSWHRYSPRNSFRTAGEWDSATGILRGPAVRTVNDLLYRLSSQDRAQKLVLLEQACDQLLAMGITTVVDPGLAAGFDHAWELYKSARSRGLFAISFGARDTT